MFHMVNFVYGTKVFRADQDLMSNNFQDPNENAPPPTALAPESPEPAQPQPRQPIRHQTAPKSPELAPIRHQTAPKSPKLAPIRHQRTPKSPKLPPPLPPQSFYQQLEQQRQGLEQQRLELERQRVQQQGQPPVNYMLLFVYKEPPKAKPAMVITEITEEETVAQINAVNADDALLESSNEKALSLDTSQDCKYTVTRIYK